jgi:hypothetical protein
VQQSKGWYHYAVHRPEPHVLLFRCVLMMWCTRDVKEISTLFLFALPQLVRVHNLQFSASKTSPSYLQEGEVLRDRQRSSGSRALERGGNRCGFTKPASELKASHGSACASRQ